MLVKLAENFAQLTSTVVEKIAAKESTDFTLSVGGGVDTAAPLPDFRVLHCLI